MNISTFDILGWLPAVLLGLGLAASSGLRAFLPLLLLAVAAHWNVFNVELTGPFAWLGSPLALVSLAIATVAEIAGDKIPVVDHALDTVGTVIRPLAGTLVAAAVINHHDPATAALVGLVLGAPLALGVHGIKAGTRGVSTVSTLGIANPLVSVFEDIAAFLIGFLALLSPLLVPLMLICLGIIGWKLVRLAKRIKARRTQNIGAKLSR